MLYSVSIDPFLINYYNLYEPNGQWILDGQSLHIGYTKICKHHAHTHTQTHTLPVVDDCVHRQRHRVSTKHYNNLIKNLTVFKVYFIDVSEICIHIWVICFFALCLNNECLAVKFYCTNNQIRLLTKKYLNYLFESEKST